MKIIKVKIKRYSEESGSFYQDYEVEFNDYEQVSAMTILETIYATQDPTLAFFSHAACRQAACGKCTVRIDGRVRLACKEKITSSEVVLEPANDNVVRDLVCRTGR